MAMLTPEERKRLENQRMPMQKSFVQRQADIGLQKTTGAVVDAARTVSGKYLGGNALQTAADRLSADFRDRNRIAARNEAQKGGPMAAAAPTMAMPSITGSDPQDRAANAILFPEGRVVSDQSGGAINPLSLNNPERRFAPPSEAMQAGSGMMKNERTGEYATVDGSGKVRRFNAQGQPIDAMQKIDATAPATRQQSGYNVQFDDTVDQGTRSQVLNSLNNPNAFRGYRQGRMDTVDNALQIASANADRVINPRQTSTSPNMGWKTRRDLLLQEGQRQMRDDENMNQRFIAGMNNKARAAESNRQANLEERKFLAQSPLTAAQVAGAQSENEMNQRKIDDAKRIRAFQDQYAAAPDGPEKQKLYEQGIRTGMLKQPDQEKAQVVKVPVRDNEGTVIGDDLYLVQNGKVTKATGAGGDGGGRKAPQAAIDYLNQNVKKDPSLREKFKSMYGYLPSGA